MKGVKVRRVIGGSSDKWCGSLIFGLNDFTFMFGKRMGTKE